MTGKAVTKTRIFAAVFGGNLVFVFFNAAISWALASFNVTPYGRFVSAFFKGRTREETASLMEADRAIFDSMLAEASSFANLFITPAAGFMMGLFAGAVMGKDRKLSLIWSALAALPLSLFFVMKSGGWQERSLYLVLFIVSTALGGLAGSVIFNRNKTENA